MSKHITLPTGESVVVDDFYYPVLMSIGKWCLQSKKYAATRLRGRLWLMHDLLMLWKCGECPVGKNVDHKNCNGLDNQIDNLRYATESQNHFNVAKRCNNTSGYKGVYWHKKAGRWMAQVKYKGVQYYLGLYESKLDAAKAYNDKAIELDPEFARLSGNG